MDVLAEGVSARTIVFKAAPTRPTQKVSPALRHGLLVVLVAL